MMLMALPPTAAKQVKKPAATTVRHRIYRRRDGKIYGMGVPH
jgi:hypothetical protein